MRKLGLIILTIAILTLTACSDEKPEETAQSTTKETTTIVEATIEKTTTEDTTTEDLTEETTVEETTSEPITEKKTDDTSVYKPNGKTPQLLIDVVLNDAEFTFAEMEYPYITVAIYTKTLSTFNYGYNGFVDGVMEYKDCRVFDLDGDGYNEVVLDAYCEYGDDSLILHYEDGQVYGYTFPWKGIKIIYTSGVFMSSSTAPSTDYLRIEFDKENMKVIEVVGWDWDEYYIEGKKVTQEEVSAYIENKKLDEEEVPYWYDFQSILTTK